MYEDSPVSSTSRPNYRPKPVSIRAPISRNSKHNSFNKVFNTTRVTTSNSWNEVANVSPVINAISEYDNLEGNSNPVFKRRGRQRKRFRSTTTSTTTLAPTLYEEDDYYGEQCQ